MGSSSLNADVNAFDRLQIVRAGIPRISPRNKGHEPSGLGAWSFQFPLEESLVDDHLRGHIREFTSLPDFHMFSHRLKVALHPVNTHRDGVTERERLRVLRQYGSEHASMGQDDG